jgi:hypothetical protein
MKMGPSKRVRCAIYTRVSTDQGLEQDFNSLDAQFDHSGRDRLLNEAGSVRALICCDARTVETDPVDDKLKFGWLLDRKRISSRPPTCGAAAYIAHDR